MQFSVVGMAGGNLSKCQSPPPVTTQTRRTVTPDNPDPAEVIVEVNVKKIIFNVSISKNQLVSVIDFPQSPQFQA